MIAEIFNLLLDCSEALFQLLSLIAANENKETNVEQARILKDASSVMMSRNVLEGEGEARRPSEARNGYLRT
jgi:hypothetical protein